MSAPLYCWIALTGFLVSMLIINLSALLKGVRGIYVELGNLLRAAIFLILVFSLPAIATQLDSVTGVKSVYSSCVEKIGERINKTIDSIRYTYWLGAVFVGAGSGLTFAGGGIARQVVDRLGTLLKGLAIETAGRFLRSVGTELMRMADFIAAIAPWILPTLYAMLFLLRFLVEGPWLSLALVGLSLATIRPLRALGCSLFSFLLVMHYALPLLVYTVENLMQSMGAHPVVIDVHTILGSILPHIAVADIGYLYQLLVLVEVYNVVIPSFFYGIALAIAAAGSYGLSQWLSGSEAMAWLESNVLRIVRR